MRKLVVCKELAVRAGGHDSYVDEGEEDWAKSHEKLDKRNRRRPLLELPAVTAPQAQFDYDDDYKNTPPPFPAYVVVHTKGSRPLRGVK